MVQHELDVAVVDVHRGEHGLYVGVHALVLHHLVETLHAFSLHQAALQRGVLAVALFGQCLAHGDTEDGRGVELGFVDVFLKEVQLAPDALAFEVGVEVVQRHGEALVDLAVVLVHMLQAVLLLVGDDLLHQFHGRVVFAAVSAAAFLGGDFHSLEGLAARHHLHSHALLRLALHGLEGLRLVAHHAELQLGQSLGVADAETAVHVGLGADGGPFEHNLHKGYRLVGFGVAHTSLHGGSSLLRFGHNGCQKQQRKQ